MIRVELTVYGQTFGASGMNLAACLAYLRVALLGKLRGEGEEAPRPEAIRKVLAEIEALSTAEKLSRAVATFQDDHGIGIPLIERMEELHPDDLEDLLQEAARAHRVAYRVHGSGGIS